MGYTRIIQAGNQTEVYKYEKSYVHRPKRSYTRHLRKSREVSERDNNLRYRSESSIQRARADFFRLVASNLKTTKRLSFLTLTSYEKLPLQIAYKALNGHFFPALKKRLNEEIRFIAVPEWQKRGAIHFHILCWGIGEEIVTRERDTRNLQRLWARGFVDIRFAHSNDFGIAGYMAKYLVKGLRNKKLSNRRAYSCSRNVKRPTKAGFNSLSDYLDLVIPTENVDRIIEKSYDCQWLGRCSFTKYQVKN